jgi:hypothetical protein
MEDAGKLMALASFSNRSTPSVEEGRLLNFLLDGPRRELSAYQDLAKSRHYNVGMDDQEFRNFAGIYSDKIFDVFYQFAQANMKKRLPLVIAGGCGLNCDWNTKWNETSLFAEVFDWYQKAAEQGLAQAQLNLAVLYLDGKGVESDPTVAARWLLKAAQQGLIEAQYDLGLLYEFGRGVAADREVAVAWYKKAAAQGDAQAKSKLAAFSAPAAAVSTREQSRSMPSSPSSPVAVPQSPNQILATAKAVGVAPGAIVCPDHATVAFMYRWYVDHWTDVMQDRFTAGQSQLLRGAPTSAPPPERYGCALLPPGTAVLLERGNVVPVVSAKLANGKTVRGVTLPAMVGP